jgi:PAS domain-containing protein
VSSDDALRKQRKYEAAAVRSVPLDRLPARLREELLSLASEAMAARPSLEESGADCRIVLSVEGKFQKVSPGFCRLVGCEPSELLGKQIDDITASETGTIPQHLGAVVHFGRFDCLWMFVHREGHGILVRSHWELLPDLSMEVRCDLLPDFW